MLQWCLESVIVNLIVWKGDQSASGVFALEVHRR